MSLIINPLFNFVVVINNQPLAFCILQFEFPIFLNFSIIQTVNLSHIDLIGEHPNHVGRGLTSLTSTPNIGIVGILQLNGVLLSSTFPITASSFR